jgi:Ni/Fe-hydrogenase subunit HybB-like protein
MALRFADYILEKVMFVFIIAGVVLSCLHQSSLGTLMVIAPHKLHPLYWSLLLPVFFLASAIAVGFAMVIFEAMITSRALGRRREMHVLSRLAGFMPYLLGIYIALRAGDLIYRGAYAFLFERSLPAAIFWIEFGLLTIVPWCMFMSSDIRRTPASLFSAAAMYVAGVCLNRCTVFFIAFQPAYTERVYIPAIGEFALTIGLVAAILLLFRLLVTFLPVLSVSD